MSLFLSSPVVFCMRDEKGDLCLPSLFTFFCYSSTLTSAILGCSLSHPDEQISQLNGFFDPVSIGPMVVCSESSKALPTT